MNLGNTVMKKDGLRKILLGAVSAGAILVAAPASAQDLKQEIEQLRALVEQSAAALEAATARIEELERQQQDQQAVVADVKKKAGSIRAGKAKDGIEAQVYGHVNQALLYADNGQTSRFDVVDNDNSASRLGFRGKYSNGDWTSGVRLEVNFEVNTTDELTFSTGDENGETAGDSDFLSLRWANLFFSNKNYGTVNLGFGEIATQGVSEVDLSGTTLVAESDVDDIGGELQFGNDENAELGDGFEVDDFFSNLDGDRDSAVSYHTPRIAGFQGKVALRSEEAPGGVSGVRFQPDASINYEGNFFDTEFEAAAGYRREVGSNVYIGSSSALFSTGTSLTIGGGYETNLGDDVDNENFVYVKLGQKLDLFDFGGTAVSIDFFRGEDNSAAGLDDQTEAISFGGGIVQKVKPLGAEVYFGGRYYDIDAGNGTETDGLFTLFSGARIKF